MKSTKNKGNESTSEDNIDIVEIIFQYSKYWKTLLILIAASLISGVIYLTISPKTYVASTSILLEEENGKSKAGINGLDLESIGLSSTVNNVDNEIEILSSPDLMLSVVKDLKLNYTYEKTKWIKTIDVYDSSPYIVSLKNDSVLDHFSFDFTISKNDGKYIIKGYCLSNENSEKSQFQKETDRLPFGFNISGVEVNIDPNKNAIESDDEIHVTIVNPVAIADLYAQGLKITLASKHASVLNLMLAISNTKKGKDILTKLIKEYNIANVSNKNQEALNMSAFINERLENLSGELGDVEKDVENYKQSNKITDLGGEAKLYLQQTAQNTEKKAEIETQLRVVEMIEDFIENPNNDEKAIPNIGLTDPGLVEVITSYNGKIIEYSKIFASSGKDNPSRIRIQNELSLTRISILNLVRNVRKSMAIAKQDVDKQVVDNSGKIQTLPILERGLLEKMRQQQIKQTLYLFLLQKREETNITMATTSDKAKVIIKPRSSDLPISPRPKLAIFIAIFIAIVIFIVIIYIKLLFQNKIESQDELEKLSDAPVIGHIGNSMEGSLVIHPNSVTPIVELFRLLRNSIEFVLENRKNKIVLITSTTSGEGKSFTASNLACSFALNNSKVLLVGMDIRNPQLAEIFQQKKGAGLTDYISGAKENWTDLLSNPIKDIPNLYVLQAGTIPPNPNELLKSKKVDKFLDEVKHEYDIVVLDSAPLGIISDTYLLSHHADFTLFVTRENVTYKSAISFINTQVKENRFSNLYVLLNGTKAKLGSYKYGYTGTYGYSKKEK